MLFGKKLVCIREANENNSLMDMMEQYDRNVGPVNNCSSQTILPSLLQHDKILLYKFEKCHLSN